MNNEFLKLKNEEYKAKILPDCADRIFALVQSCKTPIFVKARSEAGQHSFS